MPSCQPISHLKWHKNFKRQTPIRPGTQFNGKTNNICHLTNLVTLIYLFLSVPIRQPFFSEVICWLLQFIINSCHFPLFYYQPLKPSHSLHLGTDNYDTSRWLMSFSVTGSPPGHRNINTTPGGGGVRGGGEGGGGVGGYSVYECERLWDFPPPIFGIPPLPKL